MKRKCMRLTSAFKSFLFICVMGDNELPYLYSLEFQPLIYNSRVCYSPVASAAPAALVCRD